jgi:hypothetical protein
MIKVSIAGEVGVWGGHCSPREDILFVVLAAGCLLGVASTTIKA